MMKPQQVESPYENRHFMAPIIVTKLVTASQFEVPVCESCLLGISKKRSPGLTKIKAIPEKEGILARDKNEVGDFVSADKIILHMPGRLPSRYGHECRQNLFCRGTIYNDAMSVLIWVENQVSLGANETVMVKSRFEEWLWEQASSNIYHYHSDNGVLVVN